MTRKPTPYKPQTPARKRSRGFQRAGQTARSAIGQIAGKKGFAEPEVLLRWSEIAGESISTICRPVKVHYGASKGLGATLIVQTDSARAPEVEHLGPTIVARVNQFYGYRAVSRLKVTQSTGLARAGGFAEDRTGFSGPDTAPKDADLTRAAQMTDGIENTDLKDALTRMGSHIFARARAGIPHS